VIPDLSDEDEAREIARWCLTCDQPAHSWRLLTRTERRVFYEVAKKAAEDAKARSRHGR
jgi:hypothetical protein